MLEAVRTVDSGSPYVAVSIARKYMLESWLGVRAAGIPFDELSSREMQITMMVLDGQRTGEISNRLSLSPKTISTYRQRIYGKLRVSTDVGLTRLAFRHGLIEEDS